jgi:hypothetical protein
MIGGEVIEYRFSDHYLGTVQKNFVSRGVKLFLLDKDLQKDFQKRRMARYLIAPYGVFDDKCRKKEWAKFPNRQAFKNANKTIGFDTIQIPDIEFLSALFGCPKEKCTISSSFRR